MTKKEKPIELLKMIKSNLNHGDIKDTANRFNKSTSYVSNLLSENNDYYNEEMITYLTELAIENKKRSKGFDADELKRKLETA